MGKKKHSLTKTEAIVLLIITPIAVGLLVWFWPMPDKPRMPGDQEMLNEYISRFQKEQNAKAPQKKTQEESPKKDDSFSLDEAYKESEKMAKEFPKNLDRLLAEAAANPPPEPDKWEGELPDFDSNEAPLLLLYLDAETGKPSASKERGHVVISAGGILLKTPGGKPDYLLLARLLNTLRKNAAEKGGPQIAVVIEPAIWIPYEAVLETLKACVSAGIKEVKLKPSAAPY